MTEPIRLTLALGAGLALGTLFYYGLWLTVRATLRARNPALLVLGSFVGRVGAAVAGLYYLGRDDWQMLLGGLLGFVAARYLVAHFTRPPAPGGVPVSKPISHES